MAPAGSKLRRASGRTLFCYIGLPGLDGYEACRRIRALPWSKEICLVALTGWENDRDRERAADAGFNLHLMKPADPTALKRFLASQE
ncbi:MAG TPA: response regulator [Vicinamibacteria bacterium]